MLHGEIVWNFCYAVAVVWSWRLSLPTCGTLIIDSWFWHLKHPKNLWWAVVETLWGNSINFSFSFFNSECVQCCHAAPVSCIFYSIEAFVSSISYAVLPALRLPALSIYWHLGFMSLTEANCIHVNSIYNINMSYWGIFMWAAVIQVIWLYIYNIFMWR